MTDIHYTRLTLLSRALFGHSVEKKNTDWLQVLKEAKSQTVVQLTDSALDKSQLTAEEAQLWKQTASADLANNIRVNHNHIVLHEWLDEACISYVIFKDAA